MSERQKRAIKILIALQNPDRTFESVAEEFGTSKQYVSQFSSIARQKGIAVPQRSHSQGGPHFNWDEIKKAVEEKTANLELLK